MRQIHPVGFHEKFVASGVYRYYEHGNPRDIHEYWTIHELPDGGQLIRVDFAELLIEAWVSPIQEGGRVERVDLHFSRNPSGQVKEQGKASFVFESDRVQLGYTMENKARQFEEFSLPSDYVVSVFSSSLFLGLELANLAKAKGDRIPICTCAINYPGIPTEELTFNVHIYYLPPITGEKGSINVVGHAIDASRYITGSNPPMYNWVDEHGILLRAESFNGITHTELTQYARRPEPSMS
jgi:hypothetical protein